MLVRQNWTFYNKVKILNEYWKIPLNYSAPINFLIELVAVRFDYSNRSDLKVKLTGKSNIVLGISKLNKIYPKDIANIPMA